MPQPDGPPPKGKIDSGTVTALANGSYDASTKGFTYQQSDYLLTVQRQSSSNDDCVEWIHCTTNEATKYDNPQAKMSSSTWDVVHDGSYDSQAATYSYQQKTYEIQMQEDGGSLWAVAVEV